jgi:hypothetical protein
VALWDRLTGKVVDAAGLGQKKRAVTTGLLAFDGPLSDLRLDFAIKSHPWLQDSATTSLLLAIWMAQAMQDMAAELETTAKRHVGQADMLPEATFAQADQLYEGALRWIEHAQAALAALESDPHFELRVELPARAPRFDWVADAPPAHFAGAIQAVVQLATNVEAALDTVQAEQSRLPQKYERAFLTITNAIKVARAKLDQVEAADADRQAVRLSQEIWTMLQEVIRIYFTAGQYIARPALMDDRYDAPAQAAARAQRLPPGPAPPNARDVSSASPAGPARSAVPAGSGYAPRTVPARPAPPPPPPPPPTLGQRLGLSFDAWALTEPGAKRTYLSDDARVAELEASWKSDPGPDQTYALFCLIAEAMKAGTVAPRPGEFTRSAPWIPVFVAQSDVALGDEQLTAGEIFTLRAGPSGGTFERCLDRLGFIPGAQPPKPVPDTGSGAPSIDTQFHGERKPHPALAPAGPVVPSGDDFWRLTAAFQRPQRRANRADVGELGQLWQSDPDPARTLEIADEVAAAVQAGSVRQSGDEALRACPWSQVYVTASEVAIAGEQLRANEKFAIEVGIRNGTFVRSISHLGIVKPSA